MEEKIICPDCGREFKTKQALGGHKRSCKKDNPKFGKIQAKNKIDVSSYNGICPFCGKDYKSNLGLGCHIKICKHNPNFDKELYNRRYIHINRCLKSGHIAWNKGLTKYTDERIRKCSESFHRHLKEGKFIPSWTGRKHTEETKNKIREKMNKFFEENGNPGWKGRLWNELSYPEQYFKDVFEKENIPLKFHLAIGKYELDFYNEDLRKYIEIDGDQHYRFQENIERDKRRDEYLEQLGWKGLRIKWSDFKKLNYEEKHNIIEQIRQFILK